MKQLFTIITLIFSINAFALDVPTLTGPVVDKANVLTNSASLEAQIRSLYNNGQGPQINILIISSLEGDNLEQYAHKVFTTWKLGDAKRDDGVLFLLAINDRKMRIEVGQGLEGGLTDLQSKRILGSLKSYLREKDYNGGVQAGLSQIIKAASQPDAVQQPISAPRQSSPNYNSTKSSDGSGDMMMLIVFGAIFMGVIWLIGSRVIGGYFRRHNKQMSEEQNALERLVSQESQAQKMAQKYTDKITTAEKEHHLPLADAIKKLKKEETELLALSETLEQNWNEMCRKENSCPVSKLESLQSTKRSLENQLATSKSNITRHQNLINKEGK